MDQVTPLHVQDGGMDHQWPTVSKLYGGFRDVGQTDNHRENGSILS